MLTLKKRLTIALVSSVVSNAGVTFCLVKAYPSIGGWAVFLLALIFLRAELQDWVTRLNRWAKEETLATIQNVLKTAAQREAL